MTVVNVNLGDGHESSLDEVLGSYPSARQAVGTFASNTWAIGTRISPLGPPLHGLRQDQPGTRSLRLELETRRVVKRTKVPPGGGDLGAKRMSARNRWALPDRA